MTRHNLIGGAIVLASLVLAFGLLIVCGFD